MRIPLGQDNVHRSTFAYKSPRHQTPNLSLYLLRQMWARASTLVRPDPLILTEIGDRNRKQEETALQGANIPRPR